MVAAAIFVASSLPASELPQIGFPGVDKLEHGLAYAALGAAVARALGGPPSWLGRWGLAAALAIGYGVSDEVHQLFVPGRRFDVADLLADAVGATIGAAAYLWFRKQGNQGDGDRGSPLRESGRS